ncbi:MAG: MFS transporter [Candidatus Aenigmarchaeota archaeon]|nr:MFS transporter [Candidatus Aenigmarchaeota archaeon]
MTNLPKRELPANSGFSEEFRIMGTFYIINFLEGAAALILPYWVLYFSEIGLSFTQISLLISASFMASLFFEVPTGIIADVYGRKVSVVLSFFLCGFALMAISFTREFGIIAALFFFMQASNTLSTGAWDAWLVDYAKREGGRKLVNTAISKAHAFTLAGTFLGFLVSGLLVTAIGLSMLWVITGLLTMAGGIYALLYGKEYFVRRRVKMSDLLNHAVRQSVKGSKYMASHNVILYLVLGTAFLGFFTAGEIAWQPFLKDIGMPIAYLGPLFAVASLIGIIFSALSPTFVRLVGSQRNALIISIVMMSILFLIISVVSDYLLAAAIYVALASIGALYYPLREAYFHKFVPSHSRATMGSIKNVVYSIVGIIALFIGGVIADSYGPQAALVACSILILPAIFFYGMIKESRK